MADSFGASFAPTDEQAQRGPFNGQVDGLPAAIQLLAMRLPKVLGARAIAPGALLNARGAQGIDPIASAVLATMAKALGGHLMGQSAMGGWSQGGPLGSGTAAPEPMHAPRVVTQPLPGGTAGPGGPMFPRGPQGRVPPGKLGMNGGGGFPF